MVYQRIGCDVVITGQFGQSKTLATFSRRRSIARFPGGHNGRGEMRMSEDLRDEVSWNAEKGPWGELEIRRVEPREERKFKPKECSCSEETEITCLKMSPLRLGDRRGSSATLVFRGGTAVLSAHMDLSRFRACLQGYVLCYWGTPRLNCANSPNMDIISLTLH